MKQHRISTLAFFQWSLSITLCVSACSSGTPSADNARRALLAQIDSGNTDRLKLRAFKKVDGQQAEIGGIALYGLEFTAAIDVTTPVLVTFGGMFSAPGIHSRALSVSDTSSAFSWDQWFARGVGRGRPLFTGDQIHFQGTVTFERKESGWHASQVNYSTSVDSSNRKGREVTANPSLRAPTSAPANAAPLQATPESNASPTVVPREATGQWAGTWDNPDGDRFDFILELDSKGVGLEGKIHWTLRGTKATHLQTRIGSSGFETVVGTYDLANRVLKLRGTTVSDGGLLATDEYELRLSAGGTLEGKSRAGGAWTGRMSANRR